ncbi:MAG: helix-turn-helix transcriptional regulator [Pirellulaceae bacterium]|jgi:prophage regulatory protein
MHNRGMPVVEPARLLDVQAVAGLLGVSGRHVYRLADSGRMPRPLKLGGAVRWDRDEIRRWIDAGCPAVIERKGAGR